MSSTTTKPVVIYIVPGAWQLPTVWQTFIQTAQEAGYQVQYDQLPTVGGISLPLASLSDDVAVVQANLVKLVNEEEKEVILVGHSSGGLVASGACEGFDAVSRKKEGKKGGVIQVAFLASFAVKKGETMLDILGRGRGICRGDGIGFIWVMRYVLLFFLASFCIAVSFLDVRSFKWERWRPKGWEIGTDNLPSAGRPHPPPPRSSHRRPPQRSPRRRPEILG